MARRNKEYFNTTTSIFTNDKLKEEALKTAEKENKHLYILIDEALKELLEKRKK